MDKLASGGRIDGHPGHVKPTRFAFDVYPETDGVGQVRVLSLFYIVDDPPNVFTPFAPCPGVGRHPLCGKGGVKVYLEVGREPGTVGAFARRLRRVVATQLKKRSRVAGRRWDRGVSECEC